MLQSIFGMPRSVFGMLQSIFEMLESIFGMLQSIFGDGRERSTECINASLAWVGNTLQGPPAHRAKALLRNARGDDRPGPARRASMWQASAARVIRHVYLREARSLRTDLMPD